MSAPAPRPLPLASSGTALADGLDASPLSDDVRKSNEVNGFTYSRFKAVWYTFRLVLVIPFFPLMPFFLAYEAKDWSIARNYFPTLAYCFKTALIHVRHGSVVRMLKYNWVLGPEKIKAAIDKRRGACTRCAKCCRQYNCIFLGHDAESKEYHCKIYKTDYWYYGTCGRYPVDQRDIDDHACPGFSFEEDAA